MKKKRKLLACLAILLALSSCATRRNVTVCVVDVLAGGYWCEGQRSYFLRFDESDNYVALPPGDAQLLFGKIKR